ncbi:hypothetical protein LLJ53_11100 [Pseudomonas aeruginosa]|uniref:hypothetical protein n=1 Tax=Pseudomonas aeruginosa TaxID=287 RepID=UPI0021E498AB|nr:hypothetical protein [Pseudomonas aeruginosa]UYF86551.1 hypothetical protein LLJ53_11100 [Pseudomonas aeruginosa]
MNIFKKLALALIQMVAIFGAAHLVNVVFDIPLYYQSIPYVTAFLYLIFQNKINEFLFDEETFEMSLVAFIAAPVAAIAAAFSFNYTLGIWALAFTLYKTHAFRHLHRAIGSVFKALFGSVVSSISKH